MPPWITRPTTTFGASFGRSTTLLLPPGYRTDISYPLVVPLHHYGDSGAGAIGRIDFTVAQQFKDGFLMISPDGLVDAFGDRTWYLTADYATLGAADTDFVVNGLIGAIKAAYNVSFVLGIGYSNGAAKWQELAISNPSAIHATVPYYGFTSTTASSTPTSPPVPAFHIHATADGTVPYAGGDGSTLPGSLAGFPFLGALSAIALQHARNSGTQPLGAVSTSIDLVNNVAGTETDIQDYSDTLDRMGTANGAGHTLGVNAGFAGRYMARWALDHHR